MGMMRLRWMRKTLPYIDAEALKARAGFGCNGVGNWVCHQWK